MVRFTRSAIFSSTISFSTGFSINNHARQRYEFCLHIVSNISPLPTKPVVQEYNDSPPPLAPLTIWGDNMENIIDTQHKYRELSKYSFPATINVLS